MRKDETGGVCPSTLGEYLNVCRYIAPNSKAVALLEKKIAEQGEDAEVIADDLQMRMLLQPLLLEDA